MFLCLFLWATSSWAAASPILTDHGVEEIVVYGEPFKRWGDWGFTVRKNEGMYLMISGCDPILLGKGNPGGLVYARGAWWAGLSTGLVEVRDGAVVRTWKLLSDGPWERLAPVGLERQFGGPDHRAVGSHPVPQRRVPPQR